MRMNKPGHSVDKFSLATVTSEDQWYVEDPFDLKHNLAGRCTQPGQDRIREQMQKSMLALMDGSWVQAVGDGQHEPEAFFLKCRVSQAVTPQALLEEFEEFDLVKLHFFPAFFLESNRMGQAFLEFNSPVARRMAHTKNEIYVADCQLQLHYTSPHSVSEVMGTNQFSSFEMVSWRM